MQTEKTIILKTLVGSRSHGLHDDNSDYDYRSVYILPTTKILSLGHNYKGTEWIERDNKDNTAWEIGHFLKLATKCNPSILEVFVAPRVYSHFTETYGNNFGTLLQELFPYVWNANDSFKAFCGYSKNQEVKMLDDKLPKERQSKFACAYLRTLYNLEQLLLTEKFKLDVTHNPEFFKRLKAIRNCDYTVGDIIDEAKRRKKRCEELKDKCNHKPDLDKVNNFLLLIRKEFWK